MIIPNDEFDAIKMLFPLVKLDLETFSLNVDSIGKDLFTIEEMAAQFDSDEWVGPGHWNKNSDWCCDVGLMRGRGLLP